MTCRPTVVWEKWIEGPHKAYATFPFIAAQGGLPIIIDGDLIGAIGVVHSRYSQVGELPAREPVERLPAHRRVDARRRDVARDRTALVDPRLTRPAARPVFG